MKRILRNVSEISNLICKIKPKSDFKYLNHHGLNDSDIVAYNLINLLTKCIFCSDSLPLVFLFFLY